MRLRRYFAIIFLALIMASVLNIYSSAEETEERELIDGIYEGNSDMVDILVTIEEGNIIDIEILEHRSGKGYEEVILPLVDTIIEEQSTEVDAITGATVSSNALKEAVEDALKKASSDYSEE